MLDVRGSFFGIFPCNARLPFFFSNSGGKLGSEFMSEFLGVHLVVPSVVKN
jgi:hypothetical protein